MFGFDLTKPWQGAGDPKADKRVYCDCELTFLREDNSVHPNVLAFLNAAQKQGYEIILISSQPNFVQFAVEDGLDDCGHPGDCFGDVQLKESADGKKAFLVIDDKPESVEGIKAQYVLTPNDRRLARMTEQLEAGQSPASVFRHDAA